MLAVPLVRKVLLHRNDLTELRLAQLGRLLLEAIAHLPRLLELLRQTLLAVGQLLATLVELRELLLARIIGCNGLPG